MVAALIERMGLGSTAPMTQLPWFGSKSSVESKDSYPVHPPITRRICNITAYIPHDPHY